MHRTAHFVVPNASRHRSSAEWIITGAARLEEYFLKNIKCTVDDAGGIMAAIGFTARGRETDEMSKVREAVGVSKSREMMIDKAI